jgi:hypothetical protein
MQVLNIPTTSHSACLKLQFIARSLSENGTLHDRTKTIKLNYYYYYYYYYYLTAIGLTPGGSSTVHIYTQTVHRATQYIC